MRRGGAFLLMLLLPAVSAATSGAPMELTAEGFASDGGVALVRWTGGEPGAFRLHADDLSGALTDDAIEDRVDVGHPFVAHSTGWPRTTTQELPHGTRLTSTAARDTTLVVVALDGPFHARAEAIPTPAEVLLRSVEHEVLEPQRHISMDPDDTTTAEPRYEVRDVLSAGTGGGARLRVTGDFLLYVWDADFLHEGGDAGRVHQTGHWSERGSTRSHRTDHYVHAVVVVRGGVLEVEAPAGVALYDEEILLHGVASVRTAGDDRQPPSRTLLATMPDEDSGSSRVSLSAAPAPAADAPAAPVDRSTAPLFGLLLGGVAVAALPHLLGRDAAARGAGLWGNLCATRSRGFLHLALAAERRYRFGSAARWMGCAARWGRDPELRMQQAVLLRVAGRPVRALRHHRHAGEMFRMEGVVHALNAYEAARAAALVGRAEEALQWLLAAVREEPWLAGRAPFEPDLAPLRSLPAFMDVARAADPDGFLSP